MKSLAFTQGNIDDWPDLLSEISAASPWATQAAELWSNFTMSCFYVDTLAGVLPDKTVQFEFSDFELELIIKTIDHRPRFLHAATYVLVSQDEAGNFWLEVAECKENAGRTDHCHFKAQIITEKKFLEDLLWPFLLFNFKWQPMPEPLTKSKEV